MGALAADATAFFLTSACSDSPVFSLPFCRLWLFHEAVSLSRISAASVFLIVNIVMSGVQNDYNTTEGDPKIKIGNWSAR